MRPVPDVRGASSGKGQTEAGGSGRAGSGRSAAGGTPEGRPDVAGPATAVAPEDAEDPCAAGSDATRNNTNAHAHADSTVPFVLTIPISARTDGSPALYPAGSTLLQLAPEHLAGGVARQLVDEGDLPRHLEGGQMSPNVGLEVVGPRPVRPGAQQQEGLRAL